MKKPIFERVNSFRLWIKPNYNLWSFVTLLYSVLCTIFIEYYSSALMFFIEFPPPRKFLLWFFSKQQTTKKTYYGHLFYSVTSQIWPALSICYMYKRKLLKWWNWNIYILCSHCTLFIKKSHFVFKNFGSTRLKIKWIL